MTIKAKFIHDNTVVHRAQLQMKKKLQNFYFVLYNVILYTHVAMAFLFYLVFSIRRH